MFIRKKSIKSGSYSIQIIDKINRKNKILKTVGVGKIYFGFNLSENVLAVLLAANWLFGKNKRRNLHFGLAYSLSIEEGSPFDGLGTQVTKKSLSDYSSIGFFIGLFMLNRINPLYIFFVFYSKVAKGFLME